ncbi:MAG: hypothetical protein M3319_09495 [Actinomycetota bacterium]|nr:hypothetical protein [Actinomycetota bacterium]
MEVTGSASMRRATFRGEFSLIDCLQLLDLSLEVRNHVVEIVNMAEDLREQDAMMGWDAAGGCFPRGWALAGYNW